MLTRQIHISRTCTANASRYFRTIPSIQSSVPDLIAEMSKKIWLSISYPGTLLLVSWLDLPLCVIHSNKSQWISKIISIRCLKVGSTIDGHHRLSIGTTICIETLPSSVGVIVTITKITVLFLLYYQENAAVWFTFWKARPCKAEAPWISCIFIIQICSLYSFSKRISSSVCQFSIITTIAFALPGLVIWTLSIAIWTRFSIRSPSWWISLLFRLTFLTANCWRLSIWIFRRVCLSIPIQLTLSILVIERIGSLQWLFWLCKLAVCAWRLPSLPSFIWILPW